MPPEPHRRDTQTTPRGNLLAGRVTQWLRLANRLVRPLVVLLVVAMVAWSIIDPDGFKGWSESAGGVLGFLFQLALGALGLD